MIKTTTQAIFASDVGLDDERVAPPDLRASLLRGLAMLWRWRWRSLFVFLLALLGGLAVLLLSTERYTAHATLIVGIRQPAMITAEQARDLSHAEPDIDGAIELMKSQLALRQVAIKLAAGGFVQFESAPATRTPSLLTRLRAMTAELLGRQSQRLERRPADPMEQRVTELGRNYKIDRIGRSTLVDLAYTSPDPVLAAAAANTLAAFSAEDESSFSKMSLTEQSGFQIARTFIVSSAIVPEDPSSPNTAMIIGAAILIGIAAAMTVALLAEFRAQETVLSTEELARRGIRALGLFPTFRAKTGPDFVFKNSIASLQAALSSLPPRKVGGGIVFLITSALASEGKSTTSMALARSMAESGRKVLLVDADLRSSTLERQLGLRPTPGLAACLRAGKYSNAVVQRDRDSGLHVLAAGDALGRPFELLASPCLHDMVDEWRHIYNIVVIDAPPVLALGDALILASLADHVVFLASWGKTTWSSLNHSLQRLAESGGRVAGVAISRANMRKLSQFDYADSRIYEGKQYAAETRPNLP